MRLKNNSQNFLGLRFLIEYSLKVVIKVSSFVGNSIYSRFKAKWNTLTRCENRNAENYRETIYFLRLFASLPQIDYQVIEHIPGRGPDHSLSEIQQSP